MKAIILAGGTGSSLFPITYGISKQLLPVYDKPMIYYPLSVVMLAGIQEILIITTTTYQENFKNLLGNGSQLGLNIEYSVQEKPAGIAQAFIIGEDFIKNDSVALILGDNIFYGQSFSEILKASVENIKNKSGAQIFGYYVKDPSSYGVIDFDVNKNICGIIEKPSKFVSNYAVPGLYFYDNSIVTIANKIVPSARGELEITDINNEYIKQNKMKVQLLGRGMSWFDTGNPDSLLDASNFIATIQKRQGLYVSCIEEISYRNGWISKEQILMLSKNYKTDYGKYLEYVVNN